MQRLLGLLLVAAFLAAVAAGCQGQSPKVAPSEAPAVPISQAVEREVTDYVDFTGRTDAVHAVDIRPRVTGYLTKAPFKEGAEVKAGDLLFEIDPRPYEAQLEQAESQIALNEASLKLARITLDRDRSVNINAPGGVSLQQLDQDRASVNEALARVRAAQASTVVYKLNLGYTKVTSPISGQISRKYLHTGNLVNQDSTLLTTVVSLDPTYAYFDMDEPTKLRIDRAVNEGKIKLSMEGSDREQFRLAGNLWSSVAEGLFYQAATAGPAAYLMGVGGTVITANKSFPVAMGLTGEEGFPHEGTIDFFNNQFNPTTGSISVRGVFPNPKPANGVRLLKPGMFVRIHFPIGDPYKALLVIDRAILSDQGIKYVYVVDKDNKVEYRSIQTGALQPDGLRVVQGLKPGDWVVVGGLQMVRPRTQIRPDRVDMPILNPLARDDGTGPAEKKESEGKGK
jgi:membrane fusion protein, multidrug efflux system